MSKKIIAITILCITIFLSTSASGFIIFNEPRVRIDNVEVPLLKCDKPIKVGDNFTVNIEIINNKLLSRFSGEVHIYLTCAGVRQKEIGKEKDVVIPPRMKQNISVVCTIDEFDANSIQEKYNIMAVLYQKKLLGWLKEGDRSTIESVNIVTKCWEKGKVKMSAFKTPDFWSTETISTKAVKKGTICVDLINDGAYDFDVMVRVDLVEKPSMGIPFIEGFGEIRKEIGRTVAYLKPYSTQEDICIPCTLKEADRDKRELNVQAVLFVNMNGALREVDKSTVQGIEVNLTTVESIINYGFIAWAIFVGAIGTLLLVAATIKVIWPFLKVKQQETKEKLEKIDRSEQRRVRKK